jgi:hypothetical protein
MTLRDYNGTGAWSASAIRERYADLCARMGVVNPIDLTPTEVSRGEHRWIYPVMDKVIEGIERGDSACIALGVEFLEEDRKFPFGANLKYRTARALRRTSLPPSLETRLKRRIIAMLAAGNVPREYREYARLLRRIGFDDWWPRIEEKAPRGNRYAMRYYRYFRNIHERSPSVVPREG